MNLKPKGYCFGVVLICTIAIAYFHSGICEPLSHTIKPTEYGPKNGKQTVLPSELPNTKLQRLDAGLKRGNSNFQPKFTTSVDGLGESSKTEMSLGSDQYQLSPSKNIKSNCNKGEVKHIVHGRFDFEGQATTIHDSSGSAHSDHQAVLRGDLQPVVECAETSMTLTVPRRWSAQLRIGTANVLSFSLSRLPSQCGYSIHTSWKDVSIGVQYNGCHVRKEDKRYILPLLWRTTSVKISCPVTPIKSQALAEMSLCCTPFGLTVGIQGQSAENELKVNVRGEWTPMLELAQHCGYNLERRNAEIRITVPFLACGITSRDGAHALSLQIGEEVFRLICRTEVQQPQHPQPTPSTKPLLKTPKPFQLTPPFYLVPPHYPLPKHHHKTRSYGSVPSTPTTNLFKMPQLETPQQDEQQTNHKRPPEEYHSILGSSRGSVKVLPRPKPTPSPEAKDHPHTLLPHSQAFNPYYIFYHSPKIPLPSQQSKPGSVVTDPPKSNAPLTLSSVFHPDLARTNFMSLWNPIQSNPASPPPAFEPLTQRGRIRKINERRVDKKDWPDVEGEQDSAQVTSSVKLLSRPTNQSPPDDDPPRKQNIPYMYYHLPHNFHKLRHIYHRLQDKNLLTPTSFTLPPQTPSPIPLRKDLQESSGLFFPHDLSQFDHLLYGNQDEHLPIPTFSAPPEKAPDSIPQSENPNKSFGSISPHDFYQLYNLYKLYHGAKDKNTPTPASVPLSQQTPSPISSRRNLQGSSGLSFPRDFYRFNHLFYGTKGENLPIPSLPTAPQKTLDPIPQSKSLHRGFGSFPPHDFYQLYNLYHGAQSKNLPSPPSFPPQTPTPKPIPPSQGQQNSFDSFFQPVLPAPFKQGNNPAEGLKNKGEAAMHSDPMYDFSQWEKWFNMLQSPYMFSPPFPVPEEYIPHNANVQDPISAVGTQPFTSPCTPGIGSRFHHDVPSGCFSFPVKECTVGEYFVFSLPEFVVEPKVVGADFPEEACALQRLPFNPHLYFVLLQGCGVTKQVIDALTIYQLDLETCDTGDSLIRILVECSSYPGLPPAQTLLILDPLPLQYPAPLQLRIATDESLSFHPEAHLPLSRLRGRLMLMELSLVLPPDPSAALWVHYCLAFMLTPHASAMLIYDGCVPGSESQRLPSPSSNIQYIVVSSFLSLTASTQSFVSDVDPEVYFFCLTEACSASDCTTACIKSSDQK